MRRTPHWIVMGAILASLFCHPPAQAGELRLRHGVVDPVQTDPAELVPPRLRATDDGAASGYYVIQFTEPITPSILQGVQASGARLVQYLPEQAWVVQLPPGQKTRLKSVPKHRWSGIFQPAWKLSPQLTDSAANRGWLEVSVDLFRGAEAQPVRDELKRLGIDVLQEHAFSDTQRLMLRARRHQLDVVSQIPAVAWIEPKAAIALRNDSASWVVQSSVNGQTSIWNRGLHGEGEIIGHIDGPLDIESCFFRDPTDNTPSPGHRKVVAYRASQGFGTDSHGTHTAGTAAGDQSPISGEFDGNGHAPAARLSHTDLEDITGSGAATSNLYGTLSQAYADGARVQTNSWGDDSTAAYTTWSRDIDLFTYDFEDSLLIFAVTNLTALKSPENAKNTVAVAATRNGSDGALFCSGGAGPTVDGRRKPEIMAPGCPVDSARSNRSCSTWIDGGTSMAAPAVAGAAALARQYFREGWYPSGSAVAGDSVIPSGALIRSVLLNSAVDVTGVPGFPNNQEGWGRLLLDNALYFAGDSRKLLVLADVRNADGLATGGQDQQLLSVEGQSEPLKVTLSFTEPPASLFANPATVNNLDLELQSPSGVIYRGNVFDSGVSTTGGTADPINNVEMVLIPSPELGEWTVSVRGSAINEGLQGYAVVATGDVAAVDSGSVRYVSHVVEDSAPLANTDSNVDPGETVVLPVSMLNLTGATIVDVSATLSTAAPQLVQITRPTATFADLAADATGESQPPHFQITLPPDVPCGTLLPFVLRATHAQGVTESSFVVPVGQDTVLAPATDTPITVPAFSSATTTSSVEVAESFALDDINVAVTIRHDDISELIVELTSPAGTTVRLHDETLPGTTDLNTVFDTERAPDGPGLMSWFDGEDPQGTWQLGVSDEVTGGVPTTPPGEIESWQLTLQANTGVQCTPLECPRDPVPFAVGPELVLDTQTDDVSFAWPPVAGVTAYRLWRSATPDFATEELVLESTDPTAIEIGARAEATTWYYRVRAINSCNWEGP